MNPQTIAGLFVICLISFALGWLSYLELRMRRRKRSRRRLLAGYTRQGALNGPNRGTLTPGATPISAVIFSSIGTADGPRGEHGEASGEPAILQTPATRSNGGEHIYYGNVMVGRFANGQPRGDAA